MKPTEDNTRTPSTATGLFAALGDLLRVRGSGAPSRVSIALASLLSMVAAMALTTTPALAAAPEAPEVVVESKVPSPSSPSTEAVLHGVLNPGKVGVTGTYELDEYQFLYNAGATCAGGSVAPASPGISLGGGHEELPAETLTGLTPDTEYTVCLRAENTAKEATVSPPVTFTTAFPQKPRKN